MPIDHYYFTWMMSVKAQSLSPTGAHLRLVDPSAETRRHDRRSVHLRAMNRAEIWASKQQQLKRPDVFRCFQHTFFGVQKPSKTIKNHQEPSKTIKNHQKPSKTYKKPSKTIKIHASQGDVHGFFQGDLLSTKLQGAGAGQSWQPHGGRLSATHG